MITLLKTEPYSSSSWTWPVDLSAYDRTATLSPEEYQALAERVQRSDAGQACYSVHMPPVLTRLTRPLYDVLDLTKAIAQVRREVVHLFLREMHFRQQAIWGWTQDDWIDLFNVQRPQKLAHRLSHYRHQVYVIGYVLCNFTDFSATGRNVMRYPIAKKVFGQEAIDTAVERVKTVMLAWGYSQTRSDDYLLRIMCALFLANRSPRLEDLTTDIIAQVARRDMPFYEDEYAVISRVLVHLGMLNHPIVPASSQKTSASPQQVPAVWAEWCQRWHATSTLAASTRGGIYSRLLTVGRWLAQAHPDVESPEQWTRELALEFAAAVDRLTVGAWAHRSLPADIVSKPMKPKAKVHHFSSMRIFFRDLQEWEWIPRRFDPFRCLATPRSIKALVGPDPRIIADDVWAKLLWAGLNLTAEDLASRSTAPSRPREHRYPLAMVRAIVMVWLFCGLRRNEIGRLRVGCIRWQSRVGLLPETDAAVSNEAICLLDIPTNKTGTAFTKPVDRVVGEAIKEWERIRPTQPPAVDAKTGELVDYLFTYRGYRVGLDYLNRTVIPLLCYKAGVPLQDARGSITTHRARSTIASQLANAKDPMTLLELQQWLGHRSPESTRHYVLVSPTKLAKSYTDAGYFGRNVRTIEVLIDQDAIKSGAAAHGEPWRFFDLGHGYCLYEFFEQCPHRMACARCSFYRPKGSTQAQLLEGKANLVHMLQEIPLSEEERAAVEDGIEAMENLCQQLADVPTPAGPTPHQLFTAQQKIPTVIPVEKVHRRR
jgi:integrase